MSKRGLRKNKPPPLTAMFGGEIRRFRSCHHHMADGNFHSDSLLVKWEGSPTPVSTSAPPPPPSATAVLHAATVGKTPTLTHIPHFSFLFSSHLHVICWPILPVTLEVPFNARYLSDWNWAEVFKLEM